MTFYAILVLKQTPQVIAVADTAEEMVDRLHGNVALRYLCVDAILARTIQDCCSQAARATATTSTRFCDVPLFDHAKLFIQWR